MLICCWCSDLLPVPLSTAGAYCRLFGRHLDTGETLPYNDSHWRNVVAVLGLSKDQVGGCRHTGSRQRKQLTTQGDCVCVWGGRIGVWVCGVDCGGVGCVGVVGGEGWRGR